MKNNSMRTYYLPILILVLFFISSIFLTIRQDYFFHQADQDIVIASYNDLENSSDNTFSITHRSHIPRNISLEYRFTNQSTTTENITLEPQEEKTFTPPNDVTNITVRYTDLNQQVQVLNLYKK